MCGIAGAVGPIDREVTRAVRRMVDEQSHRGPDGEGLWSSLQGERGSGAVLGHRRLAIIDLSPDAAQPMVDPATGSVLAFNGEIYNFQSLRTELEKEGAVFRSRSDAEVLLKSYVHFGEACVKRLRGMFAFAIWDPAKRRLFLARDRLGIKPLYYARVERAGRPAMFLFASELRALLATGWIERKLSPAGLSTYLWNGFVAGPPTIIDGIRLLPAATTLSIDETPTSIAPKCYWEFPTPSRLHADTRELAGALEDAVRLRLISDVPLGVFLSGGVDSSAVVALGARASDRPLRTFCIGFEEREYDESRHARAVADAVGTEHTQVRLRQEDFRSGLPDALASLDQPSFDAVNTYFVSRAVREAGITVALAGTGGDELFGGYATFRELPRVRPWCRLLRPVPDPLLRRFAALVTRAKVGRFGEVPPQTRFGKLGDLLTSRGELVSMYQVFYALFSRPFQRQLIQEGMDEEISRGIPAARAAELTDRAAGLPAHHAISMLEFAMFIGERLLRDTDTVSMAVSLEVRVPLLDHVVLERAAALDPVTRFQPLGRKALLRNLALDGIDPHLFDRPKSGFVFPFDRWCREVLREEIAATLTDAHLVESIGLDADTVARLWRAYQAGAPGLYWSRIWSIFVLCWWCRRHGASS